MIGKCVPFTVKSFNFSKSGTYSVGVSKHAIRDPSSKCFGCLASQRTCVNWVKEFSCRVADSSVRVISSGTLIKNFGSLLSSDRFILERKRISRSLKWSFTAWSSTFGSFHPLVNRISKGLLLLSHLAPLCFSSSLTLVGSSAATRSIGHLLNEDWGQI